MTTAHPRPDLAAYNDAARMTQSQLVTALRDLLGAKLVAYLGKVKETRAVRQWAEGTRTAYRAARLIAERDTPAVVQTWFQGLNPILGDRPPALLLREGELSDVGPQVLAAARQFAAVG